MPSLGRPPSAVIFATLAGLGIAATLAVYHLASKRPAAPLKAFILIVRLKLAPGKIDEFLRLWEPLAVHCLAHEPETFSYEAAISDKEPDTVIIFERYRSKDSLTGPHQSSEPFKRFRQQLADSGIVVEKTGESYVESNVGYMTR